MNVFPGQGKVREFCGWPAKFRKDLESQGKVRQFENKWLWEAVFRKFIYSVQKEKDVHSHVVVPFWDCLTETVLIGGHNLFFFVGKLFQNCPCSPFLPCVSLMKYGSFSYEIWYFL